MRLFADDSGSPVPQQWEDDEITAVITPYSKVDNSFDSGFKSQSDISVRIILLLLCLKRAEACDFQQCDILTSADSDKHVQRPFKLRNSK